MINNAFEIILRSLNKSAGTNTDTLAQLSADAAATKEPVRFDLNCGPAEFDSTSVSAQSVNGVTNSLSPLSDFNTDLDIGTDLNAFSNLQPISPSVAAWDPFP